MLVVVSDTSPIRALAHLGHLGLLPTLPSMPRTDRGFGRPTKDLFLDRLYLTLRR